MTNAQIIEMLKAELICIINSTSEDYNAHCFEDCDNCEYAYAKGTIGERKEMLQSVIRQLEIIERIKSKRRKTNDNSRSNNKSEKL